MTDSMNYGINVSSFFHADWQIDNDFLTGQSRCVLKSWHTGEGPEQGFWCCFTDGLLRQKLKPELSLPVVLATIYRASNNGRAGASHVVRSNMILPGHHQFLAGQMQQS